MSIPDYNFLFERWKKQDIIDRIVFLYNKAEEFVDYYCDVLGSVLDQKINASEYFTINADLIGEIVIDYYTDVYRLVDFHQNKKINSIKISAYTSYWVLRKKPIQIIKRFTDFSDEVIRDSYYPYINESFAATLCLSLAFDQRKDIKGFDIHRFSKFQKLLLYNFIYRLNTPQTLELSLQALYATYPYSLLTDLVENNENMKDS